MFKIVKMIKTAVRILRIFNEPS